jgi:hypothetical protein
MRGLFSPQTRRTTRKPDRPMELIRRTARTFASLVVAAVAGCALVQLLAMLVVYAMLLVQGEAMQIHPGILAGAFWVGGMQGVSILPIAVPLGALLHLILMRAGRTQLLPYLGAGLLIAAASALFLGLINGFAFNTAFAIMGVASGVLGGCLFWLARRPDRERVPASQASARHA